MNGLDQRTVQKLKWIGLAVLPVLAMQLSRAFVAVGPSDAGAAPVSSGALAIQRAIPLTQRQHEARLWMAQQQGKKVMSSPMAPLPASSTPAPAATLDDSLPDDCLPSEAIAAELRVTSIMGDQHQGVATINHKLVRVGDKVAPGWSVRAIYPLGPIVILQNAEGRQIELTTQVPR